MSAHALLNGWLRGSPAFCLRVCAGALEPVEASDLRARQAATKVMHALRNPCNRLVSRFRGVKILNASRQEWGAEKSATASKASNRKSRARNKVTRQSSEGSGSDIQSGARAGARRGACAWRRCVDARARCGLRSAPAHPACPPSPAPC
eukprot:6201107-Pleurochrysis_carterae.AAC.1